MTKKELNAVAGKLAAQLFIVRQKSVEVVPEGWFTAYDLAEVSNKHQCHVVKNLRQLGAERKRFRILFNGKIKNIYHYRLK